MKASVDFSIKDDAWVTSHGEIFGQRRDRNRFLAASARAGRSDRIISLYNRRATCGLYVTALTLTPRQLSSYFSLGGAT